MEVFIKRKGGEMAKAIATFTPEFYLDVVHGFVYMLFHLKMQNSASSFFITVMVAAFQKIF